MLSATNSAFSVQSGTDEGTRLLFKMQTFGGNGGTCRTCHSVATGTVSPEKAKERLGKNYRDPNSNGAPFFTSLNAFKIPGLRGARSTAPYFHDNSAMNSTGVV